MTIGLGHYLTVAALALFVVTLLVTMTSGRLLRMRSITTAS